MSADSDQSAPARSREHEPGEVDEYGFAESHWDTGEDEGIWRFWDEGIVTVLIVGGAILFLFPEPATSAVGVLMMGFGVLMWLVDWAT